MTKPFSTQNEWIILTLIGAVAGFCLVSLDVKQKYTNQSHESIKCVKKSILHNDPQLIVEQLPGSVRIKGVA